MADDQAVYLSPEERAALAFVCQAVRSSAIMRDLCRVTWAQVSHRLLQAGVQLHTECGPRALAILKAAMRECAESWTRPFPRPRRPANRTPKNPLRKDPPMGLREQRRKVEKSVAFWINEYPAEKVAPELVKLRCTIDGQIATLRPADDLPNPQPTSTTE